MARRKSPPDNVTAKEELSHRLRDLRLELFGERGGPEMARRLGIPARTWYNYEAGVTVPAEVILRIVELTGVNPVYLFTGHGERFKREDGRRTADLTVEELLRRALERLEGRPRGEGGGGAASADQVPIPIVPLDSLGTSNSDDSTGEISGFREWIPNPAQTVAVRVPDEAMEPVLPEGSFAAIDRSATDPAMLHGQIVAARVDHATILRWLDVSGRHLILRPNQPGRDFPIIPFEIEQSCPVVGRVVCSWNRFGPS